MATPRQGNRLPDGQVWAADSGIFGTGYPGDTRYMVWLAELAGAAAFCLFATAPDVVCDSARTLRRSRPFLPKIRALGYPAALVAQNGLEYRRVPWSEFDVLFLGGDTDWKLGAAARDLTRRAHKRDVPVHMGRVNSYTRLRYAADIGCSSADGTYVAYGPDVNLPRCLSWVRRVNAPTLF